MISAQQDSKLRELILDYVDARLQVSWMGSRPPEEYEGIQLRCHQALNKLDNFIKELSR